MISLSESGFGHWAKVEDRVKVGDRSCIRVSKIGRERAEEQALIKNFAAKTAWVASNDSG